MSQVNRSQVIRKTAIVTGASSGIGLASVRALHKAGYRVFGTSRRSSTVLGDAGTLLTCDITDEASVTAMVKTVLDETGRIDLLVNNAGNASPTRVQDLPTAELRRLIDLHLMAAFWTTQSALAHMRAQGFGRIVNTSSALGIFGAPEAAAYVTVKAALVGLTKATALDNADLDIKANALAPVAYTEGAARYFATQPHIDISKLDAANVTPALLYLLSRDCALTGEMIAVGGGRVARAFAAVGPGYRPGRLQPEAIVDNLDTMLSTDGFELLKSSLEQYRFL